MKKFLCKLPLLTFLTLASCANRRINIVVQGTFVGNDARHENTKCYLTINEISEATYKESAGVNTIQDAINGVYYSVYFYTCDESNKVTNYTFTNFKDATGDSTNAYIVYQDDNDNWIYPITALNNDIKDTKDCYYSVHITDEDQSEEVFTYVYYIEAADS